MADTPAARPAKGPPGPGPCVAYQDVAGDLWHMILCPHCGADLSNVSLGRTLHTQIGEVVELWHPVRCPECHHLLLPVVQQSRILKPAGPMA